ncbi:tyrosine-type recombinase/integrase [Amycolatopsis speibonae]|uniref:Tyrosine-type recombinase/integrase n=1 Tax=Amycolatopsis speibonae TaxID=1450224 RepID=A0ABV7P6E5_9PSEU
MASIETRPRSNGTCAYRVVWWCPDAKKRDSMTFDDETEAERAKKLLDATGGRLTDATKAMDAIRKKVPTIADIIEDYVEHLTGIETRTKKDYRGYARNHINPYIGAFPIDHDDLDKLAARWVNDRWDEGEGMGGKTLRNVHAFLSSAIGSAVPKYRPDNPFHGQRLPEYVQEEMCFLTHGEFSLLLSQIPEFYKLVVTFLVSTGLRWGELVALNVGDLDLLASTSSVRVTKAIKRADNGHYVGTTKTRKGRRTVSIPPSLIPQLASLTFNREQDAPLFTGPRGARLRENNFRDRVWSLAVARANAERDVDGKYIPIALRLNKEPRIHDLRHTHASWQIAADVDLPTLQKRLGHESYSTTVDVYGHLDPRQLERSADAAEASLQAVMPRKQVQYSE